MDKKKNLVKSFNMDHDSVVAKVPFIRLCDEVILGDKKLIKLDIRIVPPNGGILETKNIDWFPSGKIMHTLEHLLATYIREEKALLSEYGVWDLSPMGCCTGFYVSLIGSANKKDKYQPARDFITPIANCFKRVLDAKIIPGNTRQECGNYLHHDLVEAKRFVENFAGVDSKKWNILGENGDLLEK
jgi:S-ribosylhomocysteine lyase